MTFDTQVASEKGADREQGTPAAAASPSGNPFANAGIKGVKVSAGTLGDCCLPKVNKDTTASAGASGAGSADYVGNAQAPKITVEVTNKPLEGFSMGAGPAASTPSQATPPTDSTRTANNTATASAQQSATQINQQAEQSTGAQNSSTNNTSAPTPEVKAQTQRSEQPQVEPSKAEGKQSKTAAKSEQEPQSESSYKKSDQPKSESQQQERAQERAAAQTKAEWVSDKENGQKATTPHIDHHTESAKQPVSSLEFKPVAHSRAVNSGAVSLSPFLSEVRQITDAVVAISTATTFSPSKDLAIIARVFESAISQLPDNLSTANRSPTAAPYATPNPAPYVSTWGSSSGASGHHNQSRYVTSWNSQNQAPQHVRSQIYSGSSRSYSSYSIVAPSIIGSHSSRTIQLASTPKADANRSYQPIARTVRLNSVEARLIALAPRITSSRITSVFRRMTNIVAPNRTVGVKDLSSVTQRQLRSLGLSATGVKVLAKLLSRVSLVSKMGPVRKSPTAIRAARLSRRLNTANPIHKIKARPYSARSVSLRSKSTQSVQTKGLEKRAHRSPERARFNRQIRALSEGQKTKLINYLCKGIARVQQEGSLGLKSTPVRTPTIRFKLIALLTLIHAQRRISTTLLNSFLNALAATSITRKRRSTKNLKGVNENRQSSETVEQAICDETLELLLELAFTDLDAEQSGPSEQISLKQDPQPVEQQLFYASNSEAPKWELDIAQLKEDDSELTPTRFTNSRDHL